MAETMRFGSMVSERRAHLILRSCGGLDFPTSATVKITPLRCASAASTKSAGFTILYIFAGAGKEIAIARCRLMLQIATINTRTGCEQWKSAPEPHERMRMQARQGAAIKEMSGCECKPDRAQPLRR